VGNIIFLGGRKNHPKSEPFFLKDFLLITEQFFFAAHFLFKTAKKKIACPQLK
jgi:hypothetical protein